MFSKNVKMTYTIRVLASPLFKLLYHRQRARNLNSFVTCEPLNFSINIIVANAFRLQKTNAQVTETVPKKCNISKGKK